MDPGITAVRRDLREQPIKIKEKIKGGWMNY